MTDYVELRRLAEAALRNWPDSKILERPECESFIDASRPDVVLALIAENDRLIESDQEATELCDTLSALLGKVAVSVRGPEEPKSRHGFHDLPSRVKTVVAERDQLKAENEALRKDAERYRWLRGQDDYQIVLHEREYLDRIIDAAMGQGEQSCGPRPNTGHGHVFPRADGVRARCGGPGLCKECSVDKARKEAQR